MDQVIWSEEVELRRQFFGPKSRILLCGPSGSGEFELNALKLCYIIPCLGKSRWIGEALKFEQELFGVVFDNISIFSTLPSKDYLRWSASNDRITLETRTPGQALQVLYCNLRIVIHFILQRLQELISQDLDTYPNQLFIFEDQLLGNKLADKQLVEYWYAYLDIPHDAC